MQLDNDNKIDIKDDKINIDYYFDSYENLN